ncbi:MAG: threonine-phosphate decarboxylase CobD [Syntrophomonadaceae bacterium]
MSSHQKSPEHGGNVWNASNEWGIALESLLDFSANINPLGPSPLAVKAIEKHLPLICHYPEPGARSLVKELARWLGVDVEQLVLGNGGSELIYLIARMFYKGRVLLLAPCFSEYGKGLINALIEHFYLEEQESFRLPVESICSRIERNDLIFIGNPNNPTGNLFEPDSLVEIVKQAARQDAVVVVDEAFLDFTGQPLRSLRDRVLLHSNLIIVSSLTKIFAIPGLRLGYAVAAPGTAAAMERLLPSWRINSLALAAARASLSDLKYIEETVATVRTEREFLEQKMPVLGFTVYPAAANFLLLKADEGKGITAGRLQQALGPRGILIRLCDNFVNLTPYHFRIAVKTHSENMRLIKALEEVFV